MDRDEDDGATCSRVWRRRAVILRGTGMFPRRLEYPVPHLRPAEERRISGGHLTFGPGGGGGGDPSNGYFADGPSLSSPRGRPFVASRPDIPRSSDFSPRPGAVWSGGGRAGAPRPRHDTTPPAIVPWPRSQVVSPASRLACSRAATSVVLQAGEVRSCSSLSPSEDLCVWTFMKKKNGKTDWLPTYL